MKYAICEVLFLNPLATEMVIVPFKLREGVVESQARVQIKEHVKKRFEWVIDINILYIANSLTQYMTLELKNG